jgi:hypothetical protein
MEDLLVKIFSFLLLPLFALLLVSCSQELSDSSPVSPETELTKAWTDEENDMAYAYSYMQGFGKISVKQWTVNNGVIDADLNDYYSNVKQVFCVVDVKGSSYLYFLERPDNNEVKVALPTKGTFTEVLDVKFYGYSTSEVAQKAFYKGSKYPYGYMQEFNQISVLEHNCVNDADLDVYSAEFGPMKELFAEVTKDNGQNCIVFLQRPVNEHFVIPNVADQHFSDVKLFGLF